MSAIFGLLHFDGRDVAADDLARMNAALSAHGPDGNDTWQEGNIGLGQRLMCFTPEDQFEQQPLKSRDGQRILVSDARIDNRPELVKEFGINQAEASQLPDSAFIMRAYEKWGEDCASHLVGAFAFTLWDNHEKHLLLGRSPTGERPLFYFVAGNTFAFSSMPKGLHALPSVPREIDRERLADYLVIRTVRPGECFYRYIDHVKAGHCLVVRQEGFEVKRFCKIDTHRELRLARDEDYVEAFSELFERVVSDQLRSITPVGIMMSGGLDSTSVAAMAAPLLASKGQRLAAFTEVPRKGFDGPIRQGKYADETPFVQAMASMYDNIDLSLIRTDGRFYLEDIESLFAAAEYPFPNASNRIWYETICHEARQQSVRVLLTGGMGNLTISWAGDGLLSQLLRQGKWWRAMYEARAMHEHGDPRSMLRILASMGIMPWLPDVVYKGINRLRNKKPPTRWTYSPIRPEFAREQRVCERAREKGVDFSSRLGRDMRRLRYEMFQLSGEGACLLSGNAARFGVDIRDPTNDPRIVEFCLSLPEEQYLREGESRWLIRRAMADRLPTEVLANKSRGLQCADWYERLYQAKDQILNKLDELEHCELANNAIDIDRMRGLVENMPQPGTETARPLYEYRNILESCLMTGSFLRWVESGA